MTFFRRLDPDLEPDVPPPVRTSRAGDVETSSGKDCRTLGQTTEDRYGSSAVHGPTLTAPGFESEDYSHGTPEYLFRFALGLLGPTPGTGLP